MSHSTYLIVGSSHAALSALEAIRIQDTDGSLTLVTQEDTLPYSPTILPYVISGQVDPEQISLRDAEALDRYRVAFKKGARVVAVDPANHSVSMDSGETLKYEKMLLATGAEPTLPPIPGMKDASCHVLRTLGDAVRLQSAAQKAKSAIILGAGLIGMHAAENLAKAGVQITIVETLPRVLPGYFDEQAAGLIQQVFANHGIKILTGSTVTHVTASNGTCTVSLESGGELSGDLLLVATGVRARMNYAAGSGIDVGEGIVVDDTMRTSSRDIWAAGDVAEARSFFGGKKLVNANLPNAVEQGRIAGMDMVGDSALKPFTGGIARNAYHFFGHRAFSVGLVGRPESAGGIEVDQVFLPSSIQYQKMVFEDDRLVAVSGVNTVLDPGIMYELVRQRVDLSEVKARFAAAPLQMGRILMSKIWS
ncbi:MAG TPA: FAD-dependent oxidoreductase [Desulfatiglandales bacterium]|nr:FAD-dependent oxidoreductase [Desulfatiglandales bacterium]